MTSNSYYVHMVGTIMIYAISMAWTSWLYRPGQLGQPTCSALAPYTAGVLFMKLRAAVGRSFRPAVR
jgi:branched-chain amino acid transport system permease protein